MQNSKTKKQHRKFVEAARESGADITKEEFGRVIGGLAKPKPEEKLEKNQEAEDAS